MIVSIMECYLWHKNSEKIYFCFYDYRNTDNHRTYTIKICHCDGHYILRSIHRRWGASQNFIRWVTSYSSRNGWIRCSHPKGV